MKNKILLLLVGTALFANNALDSNTDKNIPIPQVLEFEKILKSAQAKKNEVLPIPEIEDTKTISDVGFNVIGTINIGNSSFCYLMLESNKIIKATAGMSIKNKKIEEINEYGITVSDKSKNTIYLPILTNQVVEEDVVFSNRDKKNIN